MITIEVNENSSKVHISGELSVYTAADFFEELTPVINEDKPIDLCLGEVTEIDTAGLQMLMLIKRERDKRNFPVCVNEHSRSSAELFELLHLNTFFED